MGECTMTKNQSRARNYQTSADHNCKGGTIMRTISLTYEDGTTIAYGPIDGAWL